MIPQLTELFQNARVTEPQAAGGLQVFGLQWRNGAALAYRTLDEALTEQCLEITEVNEGGQVPVLTVVNKTDDMVFLMAGEQLIGAKQNRVLNASILVAGRATMPIPVSCVEAGRWRYQSPKFFSKGTMSHGKLRRKMSRQVKGSYAAEGQPHSDQAAVWEEVSDKLGKLGSASPTRALDQAYEDHDQKLKDIFEGLKAPAGCRGVVFAVNGQIAGADFFDRPATLAKLFPKLVRSYALDALDAREKVDVVTAEAVRHWLQSAAQAKADEYKSPGLGHDWRLESDTVVGASLVFDEVPVHTEVFPQEQPAEG